MCVSDGGSIGRPARVCSEINENTTGGKNRHVKMDASIVRTCRLVTVNMSTFSNIT